MLHQKRRSHAPAERAYCRHDASAMFAISAASATPCLGCSMAALSRLLGLAPSATRLDLPGQSHWVHNTVLDGKWHAEFCCFSLDLVIQKACG